MRVKRILFLLSFTAALAASSQHIYAMPQSENDAVLMDENEENASFSSFIPGTMKVRQYSTLEECAKDAGPHGMFTLDASDVASPEDFEEAIQLPTMLLSENGCENTVIAQIGEEYYLICADEAEEQEITNATAIPTATISVSTDLSEIPEEYLYQYPLAYQVYVTPRDESLYNSYEEDVLISRVMTASAEYKGELLTYPGQNDIAVSYGNGIVAEVLEPYIFTVEGVHQKKEGKFILEQYVNCVDNGSYNITVHVSPNPNMKVTDLNESPTLSALEKDILSGKDYEYLQESMAAKEIAGKEVEIAKPVRAVHTAGYVVIGAIAVLIGGLVLLLKRRNRK